MDGDELEKKSRTKFSFKEEKLSFCDDGRKDRKGSTYKKKKLQRRLSIIKETKYERKSPLCFIDCPDSILFDFSEEYEC